MAPADYLRTHTEDPCAVVASAIQMAAVQATGTILVTPGTQWL